MDAAHEGGTAQRWRVKAHQTRSCSAGALQAAIGQGSHGDSRSDGGAIGGLPRLLPAPSCTHTRSAASRRAGGPFRVVGCGGAGAAPLLGGMAWLVCCAHLALDCTSTGR